MIWLTKRARCCRGANAISREPISIPSGPRNDNRMLRLDMSEGLTTATAVSTPEAVRFTAATNSLPTAAPRLPASAKTSLFSRN